MSKTLLATVKKGKGSSVDMKGRYDKLSTDRSTYLDRAKEYSRMTLPYVIPDTDSDTEKYRGGDANQHGFQGIGAQAVNHLANKLTVTLFPIQRSFFKLEFDDDMKEALIRAGHEPTKLSEILVTAEERVGKYQVQKASRKAYTEATKNLIISGNVLLYEASNGNLQAIKLNRYCIRRDTTGEMIELMVVDKKVFSSLSENAQLGIKSIKGTDTPKDDDEIELYTWVYKTGQREFTVAQSACGVLLQDARTILKEDLPWIPVMWNHSDGENYGRGLVEDHAGDFYVIEFLSEAVAKGMALMADIKYLIRPGSVTDIDEISTAPVGEWVFGSLDDIGILQLERFADFTPISIVLDEYKKRIGQAFVMNSVVRRDAERVTTVEIRMDAQELETSLGGIYSALAQTMQTPLAYIYLKRVNFPFPRETVPNIVTGLDAFGRVGDLDKLYQFTEMMQMPSTWPEPIQQRIKWDVLAREVAAGLSMKLPFIMNDEEWKAFQEQQAKMQQAEAVKEAAVSAAPEIVKSQTQGG